MRSAKVDDGQEDEVAGPASFSLDNLHVRLCLASRSLVIRMTTPHPTNPNGFASSFSSGQKHRASLNGFVRFQLQCLGFTGHLRAKDAVGDEVHHRFAQNALFASIFVLNLCSESVFKISALRFIFCHVSWLLFDPYFCCFLLVPTRPWFRHFQAQRKAAGRAWSRLYGGVIIVVWDKFMSRF